MTNNIIYKKSTVTTNNTNDTKHYIGIAATTFKERYANHISSYRHKKRLKQTELSKNIWKLKENNQDFTIKWSILKHAISYTGGSKCCNLCLEEKLCILKDINKDNLLNKRSEIFGKCRHKNRFRVKLGSHMPAVCLRLYHYASTCRRNTGKVELKSTFTAYRRCNCGTGGNRRTNVHIIYVLKLPPASSPVRRRYVAGIYVNQA
jgi:hypothetical protein